MIPFIIGILFLANADQGALLTLVPWVLVFYGPKIRAKSKFASVGGLSCTRMNSLADLRLGGHEPALNILRLCSNIPFISCTRCALKHTFGQKDV
jgi:hypothetical protein